MLPDVVTVPFPTASFGSSAPRPMYAFSETIPLAVTLYTSPVSQSMIVGLPSTDLEPYTEADIVARDFDGTRVISTGAVDGVIVPVNVIATVSSVAL